MKGSAEPFGSIWCSNGHFISNIVFILICAIFSDLKIKRNMAMFMKLRSVFMNMFPTQTIKNLFSERHDAKLGRNRG